MTAWTEVGRFEYVEFTSTQARQAFDTAAALFETTASFTSRGDFVWAPAGTPLLRRDTDGALAYADPLPASASDYFTVQGGAVLKHEERVAKLRKRVGLRTAEAVTKNARTATAAPRSYATPVAKRGSWERRKLELAVAGRGRDPLERIVPVAAAAPVADVIPQADPEVLKNAVMNTLIEALLD